MSHHARETKLVDAVREAINASGFEAELSPEARAQLAQLKKQRPAVPSKDVQDLREMPWSSIDNADTRDLDQVEVSERLPNDDILIRVGIADVDAYVPKDSPLDLHAGRNTTSLYAGRAILPMLPPELSENLTSFVENQDRLAIVAETTVHKDGTTTLGSVYRALVRNHAQLAYESVGSWLTGGKVPARIARVDGMDEQVTMQDEAAQRLRAERDTRGALELETIEARPVLKDDDVVDLEIVRKTRARDLIEDFMIATNVTLASFLEHHDVAWIRRILHTPQRWPRIVELAREHGGHLPAQPDRKALALFLADQRKKQPDTFADLSLAVVKLLGTGEYVVEHKGEELEGHFGLAVDDYTHSTAPNRRYADLVTQRLVKAVLTDDKQPYDDAALEAIAKRCTEMADESRRMERRIRKLSATRLLQRRIGDTFDAIVTGATPKGVYVRVTQPPVEGRVVQGESGLDVGEKVRVKLLSVDPKSGFIDFERQS